MISLPWQYGVCLVHGGYERAVCIEVAGSLVCGLCLIRRISQEAPEIILAEHSHHEENHPNRMANFWELRPSNGCSRCDEAIIEAWLAIYVPALAAVEE